MSGYSENVEIQKSKLPELAGKIKIEVFESDGTLVSEHEQNNYVSPVAFSELEKTFPYAFGFSNQTSTGSSANGRTLLDKVNCIYLMNNESLVDKVNDRFIPGTVIGKGFERQTAASALQGSHNLVESVQYDPTYKKMVIDFPTSSGNGTFTDIYGLGSLSSDYGRPFYSQEHSLPTKFSLNGDRSDTGFSFSINGSYYTVKTFDNRLEVFKYSTLEFSSIPNTEYSSKSTGTYTLGKRAGADFTKYGVTLRTGSYIYSNYVTYTFDNSYLYIYLVYYRELYRIPIDTEGTATKVRTFTSAEMPKVSNSNYAIAFNPADNLLYFLSIERNLTTTIPAGTLAKVTKTDYTILSNDSLKPTELGTSTNVTPETNFAMFHPSHKNMLMTANNVIDVSDKRIIHTSGSGNAQGIIGKFLTSNGYIAANQSFFSRVRLESPVTKTSSQTMKISYEWIMPPINLAD
jgi:hypothetical protein